MSNLLIQPSVLTKVYTALTADGSEAPPPPGSIFIDEGGGRIYRFIFWNDATTAAAGDAAFYDAAAANGYQCDQDGSGTTGLDFCAGVHMGTPTEDDYAWIQIWGRNDPGDSNDPGVGALVDGGTDVALGDSLKGVSGQDYFVQDAAIGTEPTYANRLRAMEAETVTPASLNDVMIACINF